MAENGGEWRRMAENGGERRRTAENGGERRRTAEKNGGERRKTAKTTENGGEWRDQKTMDKTPWRGNGFVVIRPRGRTLDFFQSDA